jgi:hypothetical protein
MPLFAVISPVYLFYYISAELAAAAATLAPFSIAAIDAFARC